MWGEVVGGRRRKKEERGELRQIIHRESVLNVYHPNVHLNVCIVLSIIAYVLYTYKLDMYLFCEHVVFPIFGVKLIYDGSLQMNR